MARYPRAVVVALITIMSSWFGVGDDVATGAPLAVVRSVQVTDVRDSAFFVAWVTDVAEVGALRIGPTGTTPTTRVADVRGDVASTVHFVKVSGLTASTGYLFDVVSGSITDDQGGAHYRVTTGPGLALTASDSIYGRVVDSAGVPAKGVVVTLVVRGGDGTTAAPMGALIGNADDGYWTANLGNTRTATSDGIFRGLAGGRLEMVADGGILGRATTTVDLGVARNGVPALRLDGAPGVNVPGPLASPTPNPTPVSASSPTPNPTPASGRVEVASPTVIVPPMLPVVPNTAGSIPGSLPDATTEPRTASLDASLPSPGFPGGPVAINPVEIPKVTTTFGASGLVTIPITGTSRATITLGADVQAALASAGGATATLQFDPMPVLENEVQAGSLGGGVVVPVARPVDIRIEVRTAAGQPVGRDLAEALVFELALPVLDAVAGRDGVFAWLVARYDGAAFVGYVRPPAVFDGATNRSILQLTASELRGTLFLPAMVQAAFVLTLDAEAHMFADPVPGGLDFGLVGPQYTELVVVAPQVGSRIFVFSPISENYGWIEASAVGPV